ncbi:hypothetical protein CCHR01_11828 [Colletotrichum chrysophilum]|uniref:Uncharacterized protein n=1 Tax=Colletotrichum chrysophilum TaxID=1836956 RepID=A0AAD9ACC5_9PEZI|nr:hypothetical protein CCHR01_11828 [Colletotrichum chrysophilum]
MEEIERVQVPSVSVRDGSVSLLVVTGGGAADYQGKVKQAATCKVRAHRIHSSNSVLASQVHLLPPVSPPPQTTTSTNPPFPPIPIAAHPQSPITPKSSRLALISRVPFAVRSTYDGTLARSLPSHPDRLETDAFPEPAQYRPVVLSTVPNIS